MATAAAKAETPQDAKAKKDVAVVIKPPRLNRATVRIIGTALDNLGKGAAGQAIANANIMFGFDETLGLPVNGVAP